MIYLFIFSEALFLFFIFIFLFSIHKDLAEDLALATAVNIFLSVFSLLTSGLLFPINFWLYLFFKGSLVLAIFLFLKKYSPLPLKEAHPVLQQKMNLWLKSPVHLLALFIFLVFFLNAFSQYPVEWDSYSYHLPLATTFLKQGILSHYQYYGVSIGSYYPHSIELLYSLFFSLNGAEQSSLINFPSIVLLFLGIYLLAHRFLRIKKELSLLGALTFTLFPIIRTYLYEAYVDLYFLSFCLLSLYCLFQLYELRKNRYLLYLVLLGSLMAGTRYQGLSYAAYFGVALVIFFLKYKFWKRLDWRVAFSLPGVLFVGTFFYFRNYILTKNPFFPMNINLLGILKLPGHYDFPVLTSQTSILFSYSQIATDIFPTLLNELSVGLGVFFLFWIFPLLSLKKAKQELAKNSLFKILALICLYLLYSFLLTPYSGLNTAAGFNFSLRLGLFFLTLLYLISLKLGSVIESRLLAPVLIFSTAYFFLAGKASSWKNLLLASLVLLLFLVSARFQKITLGYLTCLPLLLILMILFKPPIKKWQNYFADNLHLQKTNIAYAGTNRHFQLYDKELHYNVYAINVNRPQHLKWDKETDLSYHKYHGDLIIWLKNLQTENIDYLVLYERNRDYIESRWVRENPHLFPREIQNIFKVNKEELENYLSVHE